MNADAGQFLEEMIRLKAQHKNLRRVAVLVSQKLLHGVCQAVLKQPVALFDLLCFGDAVRPGIGWQCLPSARYLSACKLFETHTTVVARIAGLAQ